MLRQIVGQSGGFGVVRAAEQLGGRGDIVRFNGSDVLDGDAFLPEGLDGGVAEGGGGDAD